MDSHTAYYRGVTMNTATTTHDLGSYSMYKGTIYLVAGNDINTPNKRVILNPLKSIGGNYKLQVNPLNLTATNLLPAVVVEYKGASYIVTAKDLIISCTSRRVMQWKDGSPQRTAILASAKET